MTLDETISHAKHFRNELQKFEALARADGQSQYFVIGLRTQVLDFLRAAAGPKSAFAQQVEDLPGTADWHQAARLGAIMASALPFR